MYTNLKKGQKVIVNGPGENMGKKYHNELGIIEQRDPYFKDYYVKFKDGTKDWFLPIYLRKYKTRKRSKL